MSGTTPHNPLPEIVPVFPLTGVLLLPGTTLSLHIFEPRYRNMVEDVLQAEGVFGMIQPVIPQQDNQPLPGAEKETPEIYEVGCAGHIDRWEKPQEGRYLIHLTGLNRFRTAGELPLHRGYRRVKANYGDFPDSPPEDGWLCDRVALIRALESYGKARGLQIELDQLDRVADIDLINALGVSLPFHPAEKQALLEAPSLTDREAVLRDLLRLGGEDTGSGSGVAPRTLN